jgi:secernin
VTGTAAPCTSLFKPVALAPPPWPQPTGLSNRADPAHLWWRHERLHRGWTRDPQAYADARRERDALEREWVATATSPDEAWPLASAWEERGAAVVPSGDVRPALVRGLWRRWDRASRMAG